MAHPSKDILGSKGAELRGRKIVIGITGSVSAYKAADIARELMRHGAEVHAVMTPGAQKVIHPNLMEWSTGNPVVTELTGRIEHVAFTTGAEKADLILIAPATANTIGKIAAGIDDTTVTSYISSALGAGIPVLVAPAMHDTMLTHPIIGENLKKLERAGVILIPPMMEEGKAKLASEEEITASVISHLSKKDMKGIKVLITGGPTVERVDPVRVLTNRSSGRMAVALAAASENRGADVTLVYGPGSAKPPRDVRVVNVQTAGEMSSHVKAELSKRKYDLMVAAAAVSDYRPSKPASRKTESSKAERMTLDLVRTPKIIDSAKRLSPSTFLVIFKAEDSRNESRRVGRALSRLRESKADMAVVNYVGNSAIGFASEQNEVTVVDKAGKKVHLKKAPKTRIADQILTLALERLRAR